MFRIVAGLLGMLHAVNGLFMLIAPQTWFAAAPSAAATGPFNAHFVVDVGFAFLAGGLAFLAFAWRPKLKLMALGASGFLVFHAVFHLVGMMQGHLHHAASDLAIAVLAFLSLAMSWPRRGEV